MLGTEGQTKLPKEGQMDHNTIPQEGEQSRRLKQYTVLDRRFGDEGSNAAVRSLHQRPLTRGSIARVRQFFRIDQGWSV